MKILVAEDDSVSRRLLEAMLSRDGYEVILASDGREAWQKMQEEHAPQLAILDWMMPHIDGVELCRKLRSQSSKEYIYIILLTARGQREDLLQGMEAGADDYLVKPADWQELKVRVNVGQRLIQLQKELIARGQVIQNLVYALSHDLRTPLLAMGVTVNQALNGAYGALPDAYLKVLENTKQSNEELLRLAETLLMVAKYENNRGGLARDEIDINRLATQCLSELEPLWQMKSLSVAAEFKDNCKVMGDRQELRRLLINLIDNSVKYTQNQGQISISVELAGEDSVLIKVADNGYGLSEQDAECLFDPFWRSEKVKHGAGTGLGLYLCRRIAEAHGGEIKYEPNGQKGSIFTLVLPASSKVSQEVLT